ncbi:MAG: hypothetical protein AB8C40_07790 [Gammaproteobacteria bacterium]
MFNSQELHQKLLQAIDHSENIITSLKNGRIGAAGEYDSKRAECVRAISKCQNFEEMASPFIADVSTLAELDKTILFLSQTLRDEVLTELRQEQTNKSGHMQYNQNQQL